MATKITQSLLENTLNKEHAYASCLELHERKADNKYVYNFYAMNGYVSGQLRKGGRADAFIKIYRLVNGRWQYVTGVSDQDYWHIGKTNFSSNLPPGRYQLTQWTGFGVAGGSYQYQHIYFTRNEPHIKDHKLRVIKSDFTGYMPASSTIITSEALYDGRVCTY